MEDRAHRELPPGGKRADELEGRDLVRGVEMYRRLVEEEHLGLLRQRHRQNGALPLAARKPIDSAHSERTELELVDRAIDRDDIGGGRAAERA